MNPVSIISVSIGVSGALMLFLAGMGVAFAGGRAVSRTPSLTPALLLAAGLAMLLITLESADLLAASVALGWLEAALTLAAGPALFQIVSTLSGFSCPMTRIAAPAFLIGGAISAYALLADGTAPDIRGIVAVQIAYSIAAAIAFRRATAKGSRRDVALTVLAAAGAVHLAQAFRMAAPHVEPLENVVPLTVAACASGAFVAIVRIALRGRTKRPGDAQRPGSLGGLSIEDLRARLNADPRHLSEGYRLADFAAFAGYSPAEASQAINRATGAGFVQFVNDSRLEAARRLLNQPAEAKTSIEAIGLMVGFRSRSAFYRAFEKKFGITPGAYRKNLS